MMHMKTAIQSVRFCCSFHIFHNTKFLAFSFLTLYFLLFWILIWKLEINPYLILLLRSFSKHLFLLFSAKAVKLEWHLGIRRLPSQEKQHSTDHISHLFSQTNIHQGILGIYLSNSPFLIHTSADDSVLWDDGSDQGNWMPLATLPQQSAPVWISPSAHQGCGFLQLLTWALGHWEPVGCFWVRAPKGHQQMRHVLKGCFLQLTKPPVRKTPAAGVRETKRAKFKHNILSIALNCFTFRSCSGPNAVPRITFLFL